ncbi:ABC transporter permease, partial [Staphylococcus hominis]|uniref:ABC transporter permease n=1 Tax=Staphylococcus hominis TaxID=1290 RepID=UPI003704D0A5
MKHLLLPSITPLLQLLILPFILQYIFKIHQVSILLIPVLLIIINPSSNTINPPSPLIHHLFSISFLS